MRFKCACDCTVVVVYGRVWHKQAYSGDHYNYRRIVLDRIRNSTQSGRSDDAILQ